MYELGSIVKNIRSKNAGPFWVTIDIFCLDAESLKVILKKIDVDLISTMFKINKRKIKIFKIDNLNVIKISFPRTVVQGHMNDRDMHGAQYSLLLKEFLL
tara:strand:- start:1214 stop:1513 length:300 start_codon:yes stop_codon:yes gene_type:complete